MSWRRFMVLVRGLSPVSATAVHLSNRIFHEAPDREIVTEQQAENALASLFRRPSVRVH